MPVQITSFTVLEIVVPIGYLLFSIWTAYTSGYNMALMKKHKPKGAGKYGPYLGAIAGYIGIAIITFLALDAFAYETGFLRLDLPQDLSNLDFFTFLLRQFTTVPVRLFDSRYILFLALGVVLALSVAYVVARIAFRHGKSMI